MSLAAKVTTRCPSAARHWFTIHGMVGLRLPWCVRCGVDNPRALTANQRAEYEYAVQQGWVPERPGSRSTAEG